MLTWFESTKTRLADAIKLLQSQANVEMAFYLYIETDNEQLVEFYLYADYYFVPHLHCFERS